MDYIKLRTSLVEDEYIKYVKDAYDIVPSQYIETSIPKINIDELNSFEWNIGLICGESGSGKSTILKNQFGIPKEIVYDHSKSIISQFPNYTPKEVCDAFCSIGLSSVPIWFRKPSELSVGERARLDIAYLLLNNKDELIIVDEFTSTVNREVAKSLSFALQRYVREKNMKILLSTCHYDMMEYLKPDWIYNITKSAELERIVYLDDYTNYKTIKDEYVLTEPKDILSRLP